MPEIQRLTNSSDETELANLLGGRRKVFRIPYFQRPYKWTTDKLHQLEADLLNVIDNDDSHFLGAIIMYERGANPADPSIFEVIDGQQRITTVFLYICAIVRILCRNGRYEDAESLFLEYLALDRGTRLPSNSKLHCCKEDREQLNRVFADVLSDRTFASRLEPFRYKALPTPANGVGRGRMWSNYRAALRFLEVQTEAEGVERLNLIIAALLKFMSVVQIVVRDPTDGPKIFDSLNSRQEPMTTGDLVRNEIFSRVANEDPEIIEEIDETSWQPFYVKFRHGEHSLFDAYFFPYGLIHDANIRKSEVYESLRQKWDAIADPTNIIEELSEYQDAFLQVCLGENRLELQEAEFRAFRRLYLAGAPTSTYPFLMQLGKAMRDSSISPINGVGVVGTIESFLVRRAVCGHEPTGLHAVFKRLWSDCEGAPTAANVTDAIRRHRTVAWPTDESVLEAIQRRPLYGSSITPYILAEWNLSLGGDQPPAEPWVEHVLPETPAAEWFANFSHEQHKEMKDLLGNLLPLSQKMNQELGNKPYAEKRLTYRQDSGFKGTRQFAEEHETWTPSDLECRSAQLADWVVRRWPYEQER